MTHAMQEVENGFLISGENQRLLSEFMNKEFPLRIDWNTMMPVVEKIRDYGHTIHIKSIIGGANEISIFCGVGVRPFGVYEWNNIKPMIQCVFESVLEFINWFNLKQK